MDTDKAQAVQNVIDRMTSYQESAPDSTVEKELREALTEIEVELTDDEVTRLASAIEDVEEGDGPVDVQAVLA